MFLGAVRDTLVDRRTVPRKDIISILWRLEIDGQPMTMETMEGYSLTLFLAGLDTVMNAIGHGTRHLALNPGLQEELRGNPKLIPNVTEELLRLYSFALPMRIVTTDTELNGTQLRAGDLVTFFLPAANRDPNRFDNPSEFDLKRDNKGHIAFGAGPHRCVGSHLARTELHVFYEELLARLPIFRLDPEQPVRYHGGPVMGLDALHLLWDA